MQSELETVEESGCGLPVDGLVDEGAQDASDDDLDSTTVFEEGNLDGIDKADGLFCGPMQPGVEVTKWLAREGVCLALAAARHDVPAVGFHSLLHVAPLYPAPTYAIPRYLKTEGFWAGYNPG
ncbi:hypothetical protein SBA5_980028 [Candidatus Sulfotelmatomonas gaucii]|uniref:Uncharacterized protein n=1 Tax=Candidatus Sulfuritelmatomonas gaucii TaxID=2043161 RepID=A0A2N9MAI8_9BACT|nr:hypothetical protein SBA5_980028 [Candidatus Sulfotelmatomonas gaucii]